MRNTTASGVLRTVGSGAVRAGSAPRQTLPEMGDAGSRVPVAATGNGRISALCAGGVAPVPDFTIEGEEAGSGPGIPAVPGNAANSSGNAAAVPSLPAGASGGGDAGRNVR